MNNALNWKYFVRESLWLKWLPVYVLLLGMVVPANLTLFPFFLLRSIFYEFNSMLPHTIKSIQMTDCKLVSCVRANNFMLMVTGSLAYLLIGLAVVVFHAFVKKPYDLTLLYEFIPLLLFSIVLGNIGIYFEFSNYNVPRWIQFFFYAICIILIYYFATLSVHLYLLTTILGMIGIFVTYKLMEAHD